MHMDLVLHSAKAQFVGRAKGLTAAHAAARQPGTEAIRVLVAATVALHHRRAAELTSPDDQRTFQQTALLQIAQQTGIGSMVAGTIAVAIPVAAIQLDETNTARNSFRLSTARPSFASAAARAGGNFARSAGTSSSDDDLPAASFSSNSRASFFSSSDGGRPRARFQAR